MLRVQRRKAKIITVAVPLIAMLTFVFSIAAGHSAKAAGRAYSDADIALAVEREILYDETVPQQRIDILVKDGLVVLDGIVPSLLARERAVERAALVRGVRSITNNIKVIPVVRQNADLKKDIEAALKANPVSGSNDTLKVQVKDGSVTLKGTVDSWTKRRHIERHVMGVRGVREVKNSLAVDLANPRTDGEIKTDVKAALRWDRWVTPDYIQVEVKDGMVKLTGTVANMFEQLHAHDAAWVRGVKDVDVTGLEVEPIIDEEMRKRGPTFIKDEGKVKEALADAFAIDPRVSDYQIGIKVDYFTATLTGNVHDLQAKEAAEEIARNTPGVWFVRNYLKVRPGKPTPDKVLADRVKDTLHRDPILNQYGFDVIAMDGTVYLRGAVDSVFERHNAGVLAQGVRGVIAVKNRIGIEDKTTRFQDYEIRQNILEELRWSPFVLSDDIEVGVEDGIATLSGTVYSQRERDAAVQNAKEGGARIVINRLSIEDKFLKKFF